MPRLRRRTRTVTRYRRRGHRRRNGFKLPVAIIAGFVPGVINTVNSFQAYGVQGGIRTLGNIYLGYDFTTGKFNPRMMWYGLAPAVLGVIVHRAAQLLGVNRAIAAAGIPIFRI